MAAKVYEPTHYYLIAHNEHQNLVQIYIQVYIN